MADWIKKKKPEPIICCLQETHFRVEDIHRLKVRGWKNIFHENGNDKKAGVTIFISDKTDFKTKAIKEDKEGHYIMIKGSIQGEAITPINLYGTQYRSTQIHKTNTNKT